MFGRRKPDETVIPCTTDTILAVPVCNDDGEVHDELFTVQAWRMVGQGLALHGYPMILDPENRTKIIPAQALKTVGGLPVTPFFRLYERNGFQMPGEDELARNVNLPPPRRVAPWNPDTDPDPAGS